MSHPLSLESLQQRIDSNPFGGLKIEDSSPLNSLEGRHPCPKCGKSRKYFCYVCYTPVTILEGKLPFIKLPVKVDIIKHRNEIDGKSTAAHAAILAPNDVCIYTYPDIPTYTGKREVLIYPSYDSVEVDSLFHERSYESAEPDLPKGCHKTTLLTKARQNGKLEVELEKNKKMSLPIDRVVLIDSTWNQSKGIYKDGRLKGLSCVVLQNRISQFWRHQKGSPRWYLSTIEAIHQFMLEVHLNMWGVHPDYRGLTSCFKESMVEHFRKDSDCDLGYKGEYDNLLFFFKHMYELIHEYYDHKTLHAYQRRLC